MVTVITWMFLIVLAKKQDLSTSLKIGVAKKTRQVTEEQEDEKKESKRQLLLQGKETVQSVSKCLCKRCNCKVSKGKGVRSNGGT
jgi:hypothetical protein